MFLRVDFHKHKYTSDGLTSACRNCRCGNRKKYYYNNRELEIKRRTEWRQNNLQIERETAKRRREIPKNKLINSQRNRIYMILKGKKLRKHLIILVVLITFLLNGLSIIVIYNLLIFQIMLKYFNSIIQYLAQVLI